VQEHSYSFEIDGTPEEAWLARKRA